MKKQLFLLLLLCPFFSISQTLDLEKAYMDEQLNAKLKSIADIQEISKNWHEFLRNNKYPELPYNKETGLFEFMSIVPINDISNDVAFNRSLEWIAINFGNIGDVLHYSNPDDGKIIVKGTINLTNKTDIKNFWGKQKETIEITEGYFTLSITIANNKMKFQFFNFSYKRNFFDPLLGILYPSGLILNAEDLFPIISFDNLQWKRNISLIEQTNIQIKLFALSIGKYVQDLDEDYSF